jgi:hypothetical protein
LQRRRGLLLGKGDVLGNLELEDPGRQRALAQRMLDIIDQGGMAQLGREQIDRDAPQGTAARPPCRRLDACRFDDPAADRRRNRACRQRIDEGARTEDAALRMPPA